MSFILYSLPCILPHIGHNKDAGGNPREITGGAAILLGRQTNSPTKSLCFLEAGAVSSPHRAPTEQGTHIHLARLPVSQTWCWGLGGEAGQRAYGHCLSGWQRHAPLEEKVADTPAEVLGYLRMRVYECLPRTGGFMSALLLHLCCSPESSWQFSLCTR